MIKTFNSIGTMSGTSFDGIDVSLATTNGQDIYTNHINLYGKFNDQIKNHLRKLKNSIKKPEDLDAIKKTKLFIETEDQITNLHIKLIKELKLISKDDINLIGFHGVTLFHDAKRQFTFQLGNIEKLSNEVKISVVYDLRKNDLDNFGQGAPLTPVFHQLILQQLKNNNKNFDGIVNIGGISNISYLKHNKLFATDIGPGNCLLDEWSKLFFNTNYDEGGKNSSIKQPDLIVANNYIDRFDFNQNISYDFNDFSISEFRNLEKEIGLATLSYITSNLILNFLNEKKINKILISGGGRKNKAIMSYLKDIAYNIDEFDYDGDFIESQAFSYLAARSQNKLPITFPETTGVKIPLSGGEIKKA